MAIIHADKSLESRAFATIIKNRVNRGGILANGASFIKNGENGKGVRLFLGHNLPLASAPLSQLETRDCALSGVVGVASPVAIGCNLGR
jgi:hypothetical protein